MPDLIEIFRHIPVFCCGGQFLREDAQDDDLWWLKVSEDSKPPKIVMLSVFAKHPASVAIMPVLAKNLCVTILSVGWHGSVFAAMSFLS